MPKFVIHRDQVDHVITGVAMSVPFQRCYWVEPGRLLAGCYPGSKRFDEAGWRLNGLLDAPFRKFVSGRIHELAESDIGSGGYVVDTLEASIWCMLNS